MTTILGAAASGLVHNQNVMDVVANNIANANTFAFKRTRPLAEGRPDAAATADSMRMGVAETTRDLVLDSFAVQTTDDPLHFAIQDDAFFRVRDTDGSIAYTRLGLLSQDAAGNITAYGGRFLEPPVSVPEGLHHPAIGQGGTITAEDDAGERQVIGQLTLVRFTNPQALQTLGNGLYRETVNTGAVTEGEPGDGQFGAILPGTLEGSNVDMAEEFTNMIIAQRAYQASAKTFSIGDEMLAAATDLVQ